MYLTRFKSFIMLASQIEKKITYVFIVLRNNMQLTYVALQYDAVFVQTNIKVFQMTQDYYEENLTLQLKVIV